jgi:lipopolysaccharide export system permease protein
MKIFVKSVMKEYTIGALMIFASVLAIASVTLLVRYLGHAASGAIPASSILSFLAYSTLKYLPTLLNLSVFLGITICLMRIYKDSEMLVWQTSGRAIYSWFLPTANFLLPALILTSALSFVLAPWADGKRYALKEEIESKEDISILSSGEFIGSSDGGRVFYVEGVSTAGSLNGVFVFSQKGDRKSVTSARRGTQRTNQLGTYVVLEDGRSYELNEATQEIDITSFREQGILVNAGSSAQDFIPYGSEETSLLFQKMRGGDAEAAAELITRSGYPLSLCLLAFLSIPLAHRGVRSKRTFAIANAILVFFVYQNTMGIYEVRVASGQSSPISGLALPHGMVALLVCLLFFFRTGTISAFFKRLNQR